MEKNTSLVLAKLISKTADDHKAVDISLLDLRKITSFTDYFVICTGNSERHVSSIADAIGHELKKNNYKLISQEGKSNSRWILMDYGDVIAHVFYNEERKLYDLEKLWHDAKRIAVKERKTKPVKKSKTKSGPKSKRKPKKVTKK